MGVGFVYRHLVECIINRLVYTNYITYLINVTLITMKHITQKISFGAIAAFSVLAVFAAPFSALAATYLSPFTTAEISTWTADRTFPSGGVQSLSSFSGRTDVLKMSIDKDNRSSSPDRFYYTEGIQKQGSYGKELGVDMYVDSDWQEKSVRSGLWGVAADGANAITAYPIIEFSTKRSDNSTGWRYWTNDGWVNVSTAYSFNQWASLYINITDTGIHLKINGTEVGVVPLDGTTQFNAVILNAYNYGPDAASYSTYWHAGLSEVSKKEDCMSNGWKKYGFKNQGQCVRFIETGKDSR